MAPHPRRRIRSLTVCRLVGCVWIGLLGMSGVSLGQTFEVVRSFVRAPKGGSPQASLIQARDGSFYGTTADGGTKGYGTVFKVNAAGTLTTLHSFTGSDGSNPQAGLIQASDGSFYGTTDSGGASGVGTMYKIESAGTRTTVDSFTGSEGGD